MNLYLVDALIQIKKAAVAVAVTIFQGALGWGRIGLGKPGAIGSVSEPSPISVPVPGPPFGRCWLGRLDQCHADRTPPDACQ